MRALSNSKTHLLIDPQPHEACHYQDRFPFMSYNTCLSLSLSLFIITPQF